MAAWVADLLGHSVETTRSTHAVFSPTYLRDAVESIASGSGGRAQNARTGFSNEWAK